MSKIGLIRQKNIIILSLMVCLFIMNNSIHSQNVIGREEFYSFLSEYIQNLNEANQVVDTSLSVQTNLDLRVRQWNNYITSLLPMVLQVQVPVDKVNLKKERYNRAYVTISYDFILQIPEISFQFENNLPPEIFNVKMEQLNINGNPWMKLIPTLKNQRMESNIARKYDVVTNKGYLLFGLKIGYTRATGWTQFYQSVISFNSLKWMVKDEVIWELEPIPFDQILIR